MITVGILSRRTTNGWPKASPVRGACGISGNDRCGGRSGDVNRMRFWDWRSLSFVAGLMGSIAFGRMRAARRSVLHVLCVLCVPGFLFLFLLHCNPLLFLFLLLHLYLSPRVDPLHDICRCRVEHLRYIYKETHRFSPCQWDVDYCGTTLMQLDAFVMSSISRVKERVPDPLQKAWLGQHIACIVVVALG
jgi:hypothetical protein